MASEVCWLIQDRLLLFVHRDKVTRVDFFTTIEAANHLIDLSPQDKLHVLVNMREVALLEAGLRDMRQAAQMRHARLGTTFLILPDNLIAQVIGFFVHTFERLVEVDFRLCRDEAQAWELIATTYPDLAPALAALKHETPAS